MSGIRNFRYDQSLAVEVELRKEKAISLRRVGEKLEGMLARLSQLDAELSAPGPLTGPERDTRVAEYTRLRAEAERERWNMVVQREAMGLSNHDEVDRIYPLPRRLDRS